MSANTQPTFTVGDGKVFDSRGNVAYDLVAQADGGFLLAGAGYDSNYYQFNTLIRYNAAGSLDTGFGSGGAFSFDVAASSNETASAVAQLSDGSIVLGGHYQVSSYPTGSLVASNADGSLNTNFGSGGLSQFGLSVDALQALDNGQFLAAGYSGYDWKYQDFTLQRFNADGSVDSSFAGGSYSFNGDGTTTWSSELARDIAVQSDGKILVAGRQTTGSFASYYSYDDFAVLRVNSDGSLDTGFGNGGLATVDFYGSDDAYALAVQADGKILLAGYALGNRPAAFALARLNADGSPDGSFDHDGNFDHDGRITTAFDGYSYGWVNELLVQADGKIVAVGTAYSDATGYEIALARYNSDGSLDASFDGDGRLLTGLPGQAQGVVLQADGKLVVGGDCAGQFILLRYNNDGSLDSSFGAADSTLAGLQTSVTENATVVLDADARVFDAEFAAAGSYAGASLSLARQGGANPEDLFSASGSLGALTEGASLTVDGVTVGSVTTNSGGHLGLLFNDQATQARVDAVLQQIAYGNSSDNPPAEVTIDWSFSDGSLAITEGKRVTISAVNDAPSLVAPATLAFTEDLAGAITGISMTDPDSQYGRLEVYVSAGSLSGDGLIHHSSNDVSIYGSMAGISAWIAAGNLIYTPEADSNSDVNVGIGAYDRASAYDYYTGASTWTYFTLSLAPVSDQPVTYAGGTLAYTENAYAAAIDPGITLADAAGNTITGATVALSSGLTAGDQLYCGGSATITAAYDEATGLLTLTGTDSFTNYQDVLRTVSFYSSSDDPTDSAASRSVTWTISYESGASATVTSSIDITAVNDAPWIQASGGAALIEAGGVANATAGVAASQVTVTMDDSETSAGFDLAALASIGWLSHDGGTSYVLAGAYGSARLNIDRDIASFWIDYSLDDGLAATQALAAGEVAYDRFWIAVSDGELSSSSYADFAIYGANDAPTLAPVWIAYTDTAADNSFPLRSGSLAASDVDSDSLLTYGIVGGTINAGIASKTINYGTLAVNTATGAYTFSPNETAIEGLKANTSRTFTLSVTDEGLATGNASLTINLLGANDPTVFTGSLAGATAEDGSGTASGTLSSSDRDTGDAAIIAQTGTATPYGHFSIDSGGLWSYQLDNAAANVQALAGGETATDLLTVATAGGASQVIAISIAGANDAPLLVSPLTDAGATGYRAFSYGPLAGNFSDRDLADTLTYSAQLADGSPLPAWLAFAADSASFSGTPSNLDVATLDIRVTATDPLGASVDDIFTLAIGGEHNVVGTAAADTLYGTPGADSLNGQLGADTLIGGLGDDSYVVAAGDVVTENPNEGIDSVRSGMSWALAANLENLSLIGSAAINGAGNAENNILTGNGAANLLKGLDGNDTLFGLRGNDTLNGGSGADTMVGGDGDDFYYVDNAGDAITDSSGNDTVSASLSHTLGDSVENLILAGSATIGRGNGLANGITGNGAGNSLSGLGGNDSLAGRGGNDTLDGGWGSDTMAGGIGNDIYVVDDPLDAAIELAGEGSDLVRSTATTYTLAADVENLTLTGSAAIDGSGNGLANTLIGNAAANRLEGLDGDDSLTGAAGNDSLLGGAGADTLIGGLGADLLNGGAGADGLNGGSGRDIFVFDNLDAIDTLTAFSSADDTLQLDDAVFAGLALGTVAWTTLVRGPGAAAALDGLDRLIYDTSSGALYYDADGVGDQPAIQFATLAGAPSVVAADFVVV